MPGIEDYTALVNAELEKAVPENGGIVCDAMRYSLQNGGKRIRPVLALEFCRVCGGDIHSALPFACAVEMIHTYSLIHDDLPCMDDDGLRRGKPSCHVRYGEAFALLAGDALLTLAFKTLMTAPLPPERRAEACLLLSDAAGYSGMVGGQELDLLNEGKKVTAEALRETYALKTGELIRAACLLGCIAAGADQKQREAAAIYAENIGLAFQITDDILDVTGSTETLGKPAGSDEENGKSTYVSLLGLEKSKELAAELTQRAVASLYVFGAEGGFLSELAYALIQRKN